MDQMEREVEKNSKILYYDPVDHDGISKPFIDFIKTVICNDNDEVFQYIINWIAYSIQNIDKQLPLVIILTGAPNCGKNTFIDVLAQLSLNRDKDINQDEFHMYNCTLLIKKQKFDFGFYISFSNNLIPIKPIMFEQEDNRYIWLKAASIKVGNEAYWNELYKMIYDEENSFYEDLMYYFINIDTSEFDYKAIPLALSKFI